MAAVEGYSVSGADLSALSEAEREQLAAVMKRAKEFEEKEEKSLLRQPLEGQLFKYTNVMKGWQFRWFVLSPESGMLDYFEKEEYKKQKPRGSVHLAGAVICPSDEDSQTFNVNAANGEIYRLRASNAKERQHWVNRLRAVSEYQTESLTQGGSAFYRSLDTRTHSFGQDLHIAGTKKTSISQDSLSTGTTVMLRSQHKSASSPSLVDPLREVKEILARVADHEEHFVDKTEELPTSGHFINSLDKEILLLKATSQATVSCLEQCCNMLQQQAAATRLPKGTALEWASPSSGRRLRRSSSTSRTSIPSIKENVMPMNLGADVKTAPVNHDEDVEDEHGYTDTDLGGMEEHKSIILHLLSQLKLGMDLTRVVLPTFILEKRSLLEMFADCMAHPDMFLRIPNCPSPETRMLQVVEWYLTSFHAGRQGSLAKKPYNPIIGETFHCSWEVPNTTNNSPESINKSRLVYTAEQVSHHPPVSAFYFECPDKQVCMNASIWTKSKFMGMSIGVVMVGKVTLSLLEHDEDYVFGLPSAYARSILTYPWVELGDRVNITCQKSGYSAAVTFHTKPFYGGKLHRVTAEVKNPEGAVSCKIQGEWNGSLEFAYPNGESKMINTSALAINRKRVRPVSKQGDFESRKLWQHVTNALRVGDVDTATEHKKFLEGRQREGEKHRKETNTFFPTKYFHKEGDTWTFNNKLKKGNL